MTSCASSNTQHARMVRAARALLNITARRAGIIMEPLIGLISGAIGGNVAGGVLKNLNQGTIIDSISRILGGGISGGTVLAVVGVVKNMMA